MVHMLGRGNPYTDNMVISQVYFSSFRESRLMKEGKLEKKELKLPEI
jgi:predicted acetyltransferase